MDSKADLASRIRDAAKLVGGIAELARASGIPLSTLNDHLAGSKLPLDRAARIADAAEVDLRWLATGQGEARRWSDAVIGTRPVSYRDQFPGLSDSSGDTVMVQIYDARAAAGPGAFVDQDLVTGHMRLDSAWLREAAGSSIGRLVMCKAVGNSMEPTIMSGDHLLVETTEGARFYSGIYVVVMGSDVMVKRYSRGSAGSLVLKSDNPAYADIVVSPDEQRDDCRLVGRVRLILRVP